MSDDVIETTEEEVHYEYGWLLCEMVFGELDEDAEEDEEVPWAITFVGATQDEDEAAEAEYRAKITDHRSEESEGILLVVDSVVVGWTTDPRCLLQFVTNVFSSDKGACGAAMFIVAEIPEWFDYLEELVFEDEVDEDEVDDEEEPEAAPEEVENDE